MYRATHGLASVFNLRRGGASSAASSALRGPNRKLEAWRAAARRVWTCWDALLASSPEGRGRAFSAYTAALDVEAAAASEMAADTAARARVGA
jgi:hypothetical protein